MALSTNTQFPLFVSTHNQMSPLALLGNQEAVNKRIAFLQAEILKAAAHLKPLQSALCGLQNQLQNVSMGFAASINLNKILASFVSEYQQKCAALLPLEVELERLLPYGKSASPPAKPIEKAPQTSAKKNFAIKSIAPLVIRITKPKQLTSD